jgi:hypothetical protein
MECADFRAGSRRRQPRVGHLGASADVSMPLEIYTPLASPVLISELRGSEAELREIQAELEARHPVGALYSPFAFSDKRQRRARQIYLVKLPSEVLHTLGLGRPGGSRWPADRLPASEGAGRQVRR